MTRQAADPGRSQSGRRDTGERKGRKEALGEGGLGPGTAFILALWGGWGAGGSLIPHKLLLPSGSSSPKKQ